MSQHKVWPLHILSLTLACAACAPGTDSAPETNLDSAQQFGVAGAAAPIASAGRAALQPASVAGRGAPPSARNTAGTSASATTAVGTSPSGAFASAGSAASALAGRSAMVGFPRAGAGGAPSTSGAAGHAGVGAAAPMAGASAADGGSMTGGPCGSGMPTDGRPTTGPLACIVEEHNAVRAKVMTGKPLPPLTWSKALADYAQQWTDMTCMTPMHRSNPTVNGQRLGENLYASAGLGPMNAGKEAVDGWAGEVACYTYGNFMTTDKCDMSCTSQMHSDGCGHYTQVVWRASTQLGCGVSTCGSGFSMQTEVICNYGPAGNFIGMPPY